MENKKYPLLLYREKKNEVHSPEEIKAAFDAGFAVCFCVDREKLKSATDKPLLLTSLWQINSDAIITEADLCVMGIDSTVARDQFLLINKNGTKESPNELVKCIEESGIVSSCICFFSEKKAGIKGCFRRVVGSEKTVCRKKANLLIDGDKILVTVRSQTKADRDAIKMEKDKKALS